VSDCKLDENHYQLDRTSKITKAFTI